MVIPREVLKKYMKKLITISSVFVLLFSYANAFALPKIKRIRISRNATRLQRIAKGTIVNGKLRYIRPGVNETTRATVSTMAQQVERAAGQAQQSHAKAVLPAVINLEQRAAAVEELKRAWETSTTPWKKSGGKMIYDNQAELARDIANFYGLEGGKAYKGILDEDLILYTVPEGIIYHPASRVLPRILDPQVDFIMYNPAKKRGQVLTADMLSLFKKVETNAEKWQRIAKQIYDSQAELAHDVAIFYDGKGGQLLKDFGGREFVRYELPVDGIRYQPVGRVEAQILNRDEYCIIYNPTRNAGQIMRLDSTQLQWFTPVE